MLVPPHIRPDCRRGPSHAWVFGKQAKDALQLFDVAQSLPSTEEFDAAQIDIEEFAIDAS